MRNGYADNLEIDRIDHEGDYEPQNCRWVDKKAQNRNTRANHFIDTPFGNMTMAELSEKTGIRYSTIKRSIYKGISIKRILYKYGGGTTGAIKKSKNR